ncbi:MAG: virulence RhuM family protein [Bacteroidales bacterium]|nr:virulence RhuM family protein [Bacteroidales bacterium]
MKNEIIIYQPNEHASHIEVRVDEDTVWLNRQQIAVLFGRDIKTIGKHINNVFSEGELEKNSTVAKFATVQVEGDRSVERQLEYYNLDVIISVGYRVKSKEGTQFRIWANKILKDYLLKGYALNNRMNRIEGNVDSLSKKVQGIELQIKAALPPNHGLFFDGQIFDAYSFVSDLIKSAKHRIVLIDNYIDESVLTMLSKRKNGVIASVFTSHITRQLQLDLQKHNQQYPSIALSEFTKSHDRFLIIDEVVYHFGASLKDLGKKWFAFSKMEMKAGEILEKV